MFGEPWKIDETQMDSIKLLTNVGLNQLQHEPDKPQVYTSKLSCHMKCLLQVPRPTFLEISSGHKVKSHLDTPETNQSSYEDDEIMIETPAKNGGVTQGSW